MVKTPRFQCKGHRFHPWSRNEDPTCPAAWPRKQKKYLSKRFDLKDGDLRIWASLVAQTVKNLSAMQETWV